MTLLEEAEAAWKTHVKPRKKALQKTIDSLSMVDGLPALMLSHIRMTFIINYIRQRELEDKKTNERSNGTSDINTTKTTPPAQG